MSTLSRNDFVAVVKKSGVIAVDRLEKWFADHDSDFPKELALEMVKDELLTEWQAKFLLSGRSRLNIGNYQLLNRIQQDKMGDRFQAVHKSLNRRVDLQILTADLTKDKSRCDAFIQKASLVAKLDHPNLVHVYDIDQEGGRYYLVIEHVDGEKVDVETRGRYSDLDVARMIHQALCGLSYAHQSGVIHGCLTPADMVLDDNGKLKVQRLALSPLRQALNSSGAPPTAINDFHSMAQIGSQLLQNVAKKMQSQRRDELMSHLFLLRGDNLDKAIAANDSIGKWIESVSLAEQDSASPELAIDSAKRMPSPRKTSSLQKSKTSPDTSGWLNRVWKKSPATVIVTGIMSTIVVVLIATFGISQIGDAAPAVASKDSESKNTKTVVSDKKIPGNRKSSKTTRNTNEPTTPIKDRLVTKKPVADVLPDRGNAEPASKPAVSARDEPTKPVVKQTMVSLKPDNENTTNPIEVEKQPQPVSNPGSEAVNAAAALPMPAIVAQQTPAPAPVNAIPDVLSEIFGIGPATQRSLYQGKITTFKQLSEMTAPQIKKVLEDQGMRRIELTNCQSFIDQAKKRSGNTSTSATPSPTATGSVPENSDPLANSFASFPRIFDLPARTNVDEFKVSDLQIRPQFLLGAELISDPGVSKTRMIFELNRTPDDKQKWIVGVKRRPKEKPTPIAVLRKSKDAFYFQWLAEAEKNKHAGFLRNCFVKLSLPDNQASLLTLRKPVDLPPMVLTEESLSHLIEAEIPDLPNLRNVVIEVMPLKIPGVQTGVPKSGVEKGSPGRIWLKRDDKTGFLWIEISGDIRSRLKLQANLVLLVQGKAQQVRKLDMLSRLASTIQNNEAITFNNFQQAQNRYDSAPSSKRTEYRIIRDDAEEVANQAKTASEKILKYSEVLPKILNQPISVRVYVKMGQYQTILAATKIPAPAEQK